MHWVWAAELIDISFQGFIGQTAGCPNSRKMVRLDQLPDLVSAAHDFARSLWELLLTANTLQTLVEHKMLLVKSSIASTQPARFSGSVFIWVHPDLSLMSM